MNNVPRTPVKLRRADGSPLCPPRKSTINLNAKRQKKELDEPPRETDLAYVKKSTKCDDEVMFGEISKGTESDDYVRFGDRSSGPDDYDDDDIEPITRKSASPSAATPAGSKITLKPVRSFDEPLTGPPFPVDALPPLFRDYIEWVASSTQVPVSAVATMGMGVVGIVLQGRICIQPKASDPEYIEHPNLMVMVVMPSSAGKSAALNHLRRPLQDLERQQMRAIESARVDAQLLLQHVEAEIRELQKARHEEVDLDRLRELYAKRTGYTETISRTGRMITQDHTPEALARLLKNEGAVAIVVDEIHLPTLLGSRYSGKSNLVLLLQAYTGSAFTVDRVGTGVMRIERPLLSVLAGVQPSVVGEFFGNQEVVGRGLAGRMLAVFAGHLFGERTFETKPIPVEISQSFEQMIQMLAQIPQTRKVPERVGLSDEAFAKLAQFFEEIDRDLGSGEIKEQMQGFAGKLHGNAARFALILHAIEFVENWTEEREFDAPVSGDTMDKALKIARFFYDHAKLAYESGLETIAAQRAVFQKIAEMESATFSGNELFQAMKGSKYVKHAEDLKPVLAALVARRYIFKEPEPERSGAGRKPSPRYCLNPAALRLEQRDKRN